MNETINLKKSNNLFYIFYYITHHLTQCPAVKIYRSLIKAPPQCNFPLLKIVAIQGKTWGILMNPPTILFEIPSPESPHSITRNIKFKLTLINCDNSFKFKFTIQYEILIQTQFI